MSVKSDPALGACLRFAGPLASEVQPDLDDPIEGLCKSTAKPLGVATGAGPILAMRGRPTVHVHELKWFLSWQKSRQCGTDSLYQSLLDTFVWCLKIFRIAVSETS